MIDFKQKFIFVHVTKTGGTSVEKALGGKLHDHRVCRKYQSEYGVDIFNHFSSFSIVRNPWDKIVSHYIYLRLHKKSNEVKDPAKDIASIVKDLTFNEWVEKIGRGEKVAAFPLKHFDYLKVDGKMVIENIIRFENLEKDFNRICSKLDIKRTKLPHLNKSHHAHYSNYYNKRTRDIIGKFYEEEVDYFKYTYDRL